MLDRIAAHPLARNPRRIGTIIAIEVAEGEGRYLSDLGPRMNRAFRERGLLLRPMGNCLYVMPPYCLDDAQARRIGDAAIEVLEELKR